MLCLRQRLTLLELGGDESDNLNFMNFKIDSIKIRKNSWILGSFKIHKLRILNLWVGLYGRNVGRRLIVAR